LSFLTKFFVVLHVVLTMLFVSAAVVFVNRVEAFKTAETSLNARLASATNEAQVAKGLASDAMSDATAVRQQTAAEVAAVRQQLAAAQTAMRERDTQLAIAQQNVSSADARLQATTAALQTSQTTTSLLQEQINQTREAGNKTQQQNTELLTANSDLNSRLQVALRQLRNGNEEIEALRNQVADANSGSRPAAAGGDAAAGAMTPGATDVAINGVIRDQRNINGVQYATISIGSSDQVTKGMVFNIIDREAGDFLGYLTVDRVEPNEATGRLQGPRVAEVKQGNEVRTQL